jgi:GIY-YIG catalytic domain.
MIKKSGIYGIANVEEKKVYIGKSTDIDRRWKEHQNKLSKGTHHNKALQESYDIYGADAFQYKIIELVPESQYSFVELEYIDKYAKKNKAYNVYGDKDELRFRLAKTLSDDLNFQEVRVDEAMSECLSDKGNPLKIAVYGRYNDDEVYIHIYSKDFEQKDKDARFLYCNNSYDKHYFEIGVSNYEKADIDSVIENITVKVKSKVGWNYGNTESWKNRKNIF